MRAQAEPESAPVVVRHEAVRTAPAIPTPAHDGGETASGDGQPSLLKRVTAALQRAVRGPEGDKPSES